MAHDKEIKYKSKHYLHFDAKRKYNMKTKNYVSNYKKIESHGFYPFIRYVSKTEKYKLNNENPDTRPIKTKRRTIMYASHTDNYIYKYYGEKLNEKYNHWVEKELIDDCSIAYRFKREQPGKSNIDHSAEVINKIHNMDSCFIMIGDFKGYFDNLDHQRLKKNLCRVLRCGNNKLPKDWFNVFQSVTKYSYYNQKLIHKHCGTERQLKRDGRIRYFSSPKEFREFKERYSVSTNLNNHGIPQGTAISSILSNVYAIEFDKEVNRIVQEKGGFYRRYSDDFIIVIPENHFFRRGCFELFVKYIYTLIKDNDMIIEPHKTKLFCRQKDSINNFHDLSITTMDYLGFVYDGLNVEMRGKSPYKFYRHARRLIKMAINTKKKKGLKKLPYRRQIYALYTDLGLERRPYGNFISYSRRSQKIFDRISPHTNNRMMLQVKNRRKKISKMMGYDLVHQIRRSELKKNS